MNDQIRSFIAVPVPPETAEKLRAAQDLLRRAGPGVKWVDTSTLHITLKFLGSVERDRLNATWQSVEEGLDGGEPFTMRCRGIGAFPNKRRPRVVWAGVAEGAAELTDLAVRVDRACGEHNFEQEGRPFHPHVTLGRVRGPMSDPELASAITDLQETDFGEARVERVLLMKSQLTPRGAVYHVLDEKPLR